MNLITRLATQGGRRWRAMGFGGLLRMLVVGTAAEAPATSAIATIIFYAPADPTAFSAFRDPTTFTAETDRTTYAAPLDATTFTVPA